MARLINARMTLTEIEYQPHRSIFIVFPICSRRICNPSLGRWIACGATVPQIQQERTYSFNATLAATKSGSHTGAMGGT